MRRAAALLAGCALALAASAADFDLARLMEQLRTHPPGRAHFNETRYLALLDRPLESAGELAFTPPDRLEKRTTSPGSERLVVEGERATIERGGRTQSLALAEFPQVAVLVDSIRATLAGNRRLLERTYEVKLEGDARAWKLVLRPRDAAVAQLVTRVVIGGSQAQVQRVEIEQADGDRSLMQIAPARP